MKRGFSTQLFKTISDFQQFKLLEEIRYGATDGTQYLIPLYASSDLASTPQAVWGALLFLVPNGWYAVSAFLHDSAFQNTLLVEDANGIRRLANLTEAQANDLLLEAMHWQKPTPTDFERLQMNAIYEGVAIGGWNAFKEDRS